VQGSATAGRLDNEERRSLIRWLDPSQHEFIYERMSKYVRDANRQLWRFASVGTTKLIQLAQYDDAQRGHYDWHTDVMPSSSGARHKGARLLSVTVQLSDPAHYAGGSLQLGTHNATSEQGAMVVFPSYLCHKVFPVTQGQRFSLVGWYLGDDVDYWKAAGQSYDMLTRALPAFESGHTMLAMVRASERRSGQSRAVKRHEHFP
jgi:PKHD-type hydroxylase